MRAMVVTSMALLVLHAVAGCGTPPVEIKPGDANLVTAWSRIASDTINDSPASPTGSPAERHPWVGQDLGLVHVAIYDAVVAISGGYRPFAVTPTAMTAGASPQAAAIAAAHGILAGLYPNRRGVYEARYAAAIAALPSGDARDKGIAVGSEVAQQWLALRGDDGRDVVLASYVPGTQPGQFRGNIAVGRALAFVKPLALTTASQFRLPEPLALTTPAYAHDVNETEAIGGSVSSMRTPAQLEAAQFHTEVPWAFWPRNLQRLGDTPGSLIEHARLLAMLFVADGDAEIACFDSKYAYRTWRPYSAINLADTDGNDATVADPGWKPVLPTPPHPEYPAAHSCVAAAVAQALESYYGTSRVRFSFDSHATESTHTYATTQALVDDVAMARMAGGMHFRFSIDAGNRLGRTVASWMAERNFQSR